jgi:phage gp45-like
LIDLKNISARIRNLITTGKLTNRDGDKIQGTTRYGKTVNDKKEMFPYGFIAKAKSGTMIFFFEGGDAGSPIILPVCNIEGAPDLEDGDAALWTESGGWIVVRESGSVELYGKKYGGLIKVDELKSQLEKNNSILSTLLSITCGTPLSEPGNGSPSVFQSTLALALSSASVGDFSNIASTKVFHGDGTD